MDGRRGVRRGCKACQLATGDGISLPTIYEYRPSLPALPSHITPMSRLRPRGARLGTPASSSPLVRIVARAGQRPALAPCPWTLTLAWLVT